MVEHSSSTLTARALAATRGNDATTERTMDLVLSTLLAELDGVDDCDSPIAVIGITLDASWIDSALKRPGRLEKVVYL
jgi:SpoVK/Ycf46/Vps4 family AAA+-type ATPase